MAVRSQVDSNFEFQKGLHSQNLEALIRARPLAKGD